MIGLMILVVGLLFGPRAPLFLSLIPLSVLGVLLVIVGIYHALLIRDVKAKKQLAVVATVAIFNLLFGNLAYGFGAGILLHHLLKFDVSRVWHAISPKKKYRVPEMQPINQRRARIHSLEQSEV